jgi:hypothetical protein
MAPLAILLISVEFKVRFQQISRQPWQAEARSGYTSSAQALHPLAGNTNEGSGKITF